MHAERGSRPLALAAIRTDDLRHLRRIYEGAAFYLQRYCFSTLFLYFAYKSIRPILVAFEAGFGAGPDHGGHPSSASSVASGSTLVPAAVLTLFNLATGTLLALMRRPLDPPRRIVEVVIPSVATLLSSAFNLTWLLPTVLNARLLPASAAATLASAALTTLGWAIAMCTLWYLRFSFAIFVQAGELVRAGPYKYVRHPMYLGYLFVLAGMVIARPNAAVLLLSIAQVAIMLYRARLEEYKLLQTYPTIYRELMADAGLLFPRAWSGRRRSLPSRRADNSKP
jgi:protein-S-isoprenylcysteine O-methyltransferase Ste14